MPSGRPPGSKSAGLSATPELGIPFDPVFPTLNGTFQSEANVRSHWRAIRGDDLKWVVPHSVRKTVVTAVERAVGLEAAARQAGHGSSDVTRRHYVERGVEVPDYTAALDAYSRPIRALRVVPDAEARLRNPLYLHLWSRLGESNS